MKDCQWGVKDVFRGRRTGRTRKKLNVINFNLRGGLVSVQKSPQPPFQRGRLNGAAFFNGGLSAVSFELGVLIKNLP
jgi:hypothetical protein